MQFAQTVRQVEILEAVILHGSNVKAAVAMGVQRRGVDGAINRIKAQAARQGHSPAHDMRHTVPDGYHVKGVSTLYGSDGKPSAQWVKSSIDADRQAEMQRAAIAAMCEEIPKVGKINPPVGTLGHLCNVYTLTDSHVGMLAWGKESGEDWDLSIAEATLVGCFQQMIDCSPKATTAFVNQLGDFLHYDGFESVTPTHRHVLDADSRFEKMVKTAIRVLRRVVAIALERHDRVVLLLAEGNHDPAGSVWLRALFHALYENEPRIHVIDSPLPYYAHQHGDTLLAFHHGHLKKNDNLPILFAAQFAKLWGNTTRRYAHTGHRHHSEEKEHSGMTVIQHPTLAARDAHAARGGWVANRQVTSITYSDKHGQVARTTVVPEMLDLN